MVLTASELKKQARQHLKGQWGKVALITLIYSIYAAVFTFLSTLDFIGIIFSIIFIVITMPISYGFVKVMMKLKRNEDVKYFDFFVEGFKNFPRAWFITGRLILKFIAPIILLIVSVVLIIIISVINFANNFLFNASSFSIIFTWILTILSIVLMIISYVWLIIKSFRYSLSMYIAIDNENERPVDCVNKSKELMDGNKGRLFCLLFSFIGWYLLIAIVLFLFRDLSFITSFILLVAETFLIPYVSFSMISFYENVTGIDNSTTVTSDSVSSENNIQELSGSQDVKAEIVDIPNAEENDSNKNNDDENNE